MAVVLMYVEAARRRRTCTVLEGKSQEWSLETEAAS